MQEFLTDPNILFILLTLGIFALIYEVAMPGGFIAGTLALILLSAGGYALTIVPFSILGLVLLVIGIITMASEAMVVTKGLLALTGAVIFTIGSFLMFSGDAQQLSWITIGSTTVFVAGGLTFLLSYIIKLYRRNPAAALGLTGQKALVIDWNDDMKRVEIEGAFWAARSLNNRTYQHGDWAVVQGQDNITLLVD